MAWFIARSLRAHRRPEEVRIIRKTLLEPPDPEPPASQPEPPQPSSRMGQVNSQLLDELGRLDEQVF